MKGGVSRLSNNKFRSGTSRDYPNDGLDLGCFIGKLGNNHSEFDKSLGFNCHG